MATTAAAGWAGCASGASRAVPSAGVVLAEHLVVHRHQRVDAAPSTTARSSHALGRRHVERQVRDLGDEQRLGRLGREPAASSRAGRSGGGS